MLRFPSYAPRDSRRVSLQFSPELATEAKVFLTLPIKLVSCEAESSKTAKVDAVLAMDLTLGYVVLFISSSRAYRHMLSVQALQGRRVHA